MTRKPTRAYTREHKHVSLRALSLHLSLSLSLSLSISLSLSLSLSLFSSCASLSPGYKRTLLGRNKHAPAFSKSPTKQACRELVASGWSQHDAACTDDEGERTKTRRRIRKGGEKPAVRNESCDLARSKRERSEEVDHTKSIIKASSLFFNALAHQMAALDWAECCWEPTSALQSHDQPQQRTGPPLPTMQSAEL
jgi:hypothetical protein